MSQETSGAVQGSTPADRRSQTPRSPYPNHEIGATLRLGLAETRLQCDFCKGTIANGEPFCFYLSSPDAEREGYACMVDAGEIFQGWFSRSIGRVNEILREEWTRKATEGISTAAAVLLPVDPELITYVGKGIPQSEVDRTKHG